MNIITKKEDNKMVVALEGRLDTTTAPELEKIIKEQLIDIANLDFDLASLEYVSSAGLRVFLLAQKNVNRLGGSMKLFSVNDVIKEIFEVTGFTQILTIE